MYVQQSEAVVYKIETQRLMRLRTSRMSRTDVMHGAQCAGVSQLGSKVASVWMDGVFCVEDASEHDVKRRGPVWTPMAQWQICTQLQTATGSSCTLPMDRITASSPCVDGLQEAGESNQEKVGQNFLEKQAAEMRSLRSWVP